jgi:hypothetical protein
MYRCNVCDVVSKPGTPRRVFAQKRADGQIREEIPVCDLCLDKLNRGLSPVDLYRAHHPVPVEVIPEPVFTPKPVPQQPTRPVFSSGKTLFKGTKNGKHVS